MDGIVVAGGLVGRDVELGRVDGFVARVGCGAVSLVLEGDAGIGKSALWREGCARAAAAGALVLVCRPAAAEAKLSFSALADLLESVDGEDLAGLPPAQRQAVEVALLRAEPGEVAPDPRTVAVALRSILCGLAETQPVVVAIDDAQWLDSSSAAAIEFALRRRGDCRVGVLVARRPGSALEDLVVSADRVAVGPLSRAAVYHLIEDRLGRSLLRPLLVRVHDAAAGNPFFALEIARTVIDAGLGPAEPLPIPDRLADLVSRRVERLSASGREALVVAAAVGQPTVELIARVLDHDVTDGLEEAETEGLIEVRDGIVCFVHPLYSAAVYSSAPNGQRRDLHHRLAGAVGACEEQARHLALSTVGPDAEVADCLDEAARAARARRSSMAAAELAELAVNLTPADRSDDRADRQLRLAEYLLHGGDAERARPLLEALSVPAERSGRRARALLSLAALRFRECGARAAVDCCEQALEASAGSDRSLRAKCHIDLACYCDFDFRRAERHIRAAARLLRADGDGVDREVLCQVLAHEALASLVRGRGLPVPELLRAIETEGPVLGWHVVGRVNTKLGQWLKYIDDLDGARQRLERARQEALDVGDDSSLPTVLMHLSQTECWAGNWARAAAYGDEACVLADQLGQGFGGPAAHQAYLDAHAGGIDRAVATATAGLVHSAANPLMAPLFLRVLGFLALSRGHLTEADRHLTAALDAAEHTGILEPNVLRIHADAVEALIGLGQLDRAEQLLVTWEAQAERVGLAWSQATSARCRALLAAARGDLAGARQALARALSHHQRLDVPFELARTRLVEGQIERRAKQKLAARQALQRALTIFEQLGAPLWAARAHDELARIGQRTTAPGQLTASERRVAELAAGGLTNRQVGAALFMSPKTVEANLGRVYCKLAIKSRAELGVRLVATDMGTPSAPAYRHTVGPAPANDTDRVDWHVLARV